MTTPIYQKVSSAANLTGLSSGLIVVEFSTRRYFDLFTMAHYHVIADQKTALRKFSHASDTLQLWRNEIVVQERKLLKKHISLR